jgi:hypothetical protein
MFYCFDIVLVIWAEEYILQKKRGIVLFDDNSEELEMLFIDDDGFLQMPKKHDDDIVRGDVSTKKRVLGGIKDDISEYK